MEEVFLLAGNEDRKRLMEAMEYTGTNSAFVMKMEVMFSSMHAVAGTSILRGARFLL